MRNRTTEPDLHEKVVLLTGASGGLGGVLARRLADRGAILVLTGRRADRLEKLAAELTSGGATVHVVPADLSSPTDIEALLAKVGKDAGAIDVLVSNAGVEYYGSYARNDVRELEETITTNLIGPMTLVRAVLPGMLVRGTGRIVLMSSISGKAPNPYGAAYAASKAGLVGLSSSLRTELTGTGVSCSVICPAFVTDVEDGMFIRIQREGLPTPPGMVGVAPASRCADSVLRVLRTGEPEIIVSNKPLRLMLAAAILWPSLAERVLTRAGVPKYFKQLSAIRGRL